MKRISWLLGLMFISLVTAGHEFWLQPGKYFYFIREIASISFRVGEHFTGENWNGNASRIQQLAHYSPNGARTDISSRLSMQPGDSMKLPLQQEGTHMVIFHGTNSFIELEPDKFTDYLLEDGLEWVDKYRQEHGESGKKSREFYQRSVKTLLQVGNSFSNSCTKATSLPVDIIPVKNPYEPPGRAPREEQPTVMFKVHFKGKPLSQQAMRIWYKGKDGKTIMETQYTNKKGIFSTKRYTGPNMISTVFMERLHNDPKADWQSYWGSLTFEFSQF